jgi:hypothetical protein
VGERGREGESAAEPSRAAREFHIFSDEQDGNYLFPHFRQLGRLFSKNISL